MLSLAKRIASIPGEFVLGHELSKSVISEVFLCTLNNMNAVIKLDSLCAARLAIDRPVSYTHLTLPTIRSV